MDQAESDNLEGLEDQNVPGIISFSANIDQAPQWRRLI